MNICKLTLGNLRCFPEEKEQINISPITIIVGENSSGKTTFLSAYEFLHNILYANQKIHPSLVEDVLKGISPQCLGGSFKDALRTHDAPAIVGATLKIDEKNFWDIEYAIDSSGFCKQIVMGTSILNDDWRIKIQIEKNGIYDAILMKNNETKEKWTKQSLPPAFSIGFFHLADFIDTLLASGNYAVLCSKISSIIKEKSKKFVCKSIAPVEASRRKIYDPTDIKSKESSFILCEMAKLSNSSNWEKIEGKLTEFGLNSGLFQSIAFNTLGPGDEAPFRIKANVGGVQSDIINVGHGVGQFLPILGDIFISDEDNYNTFLIQQPETHTHPKVEAEFSTLMADIIKECPKHYHFICESHSEYIINRARIEIIERRLKPNDFLILHLELKGGQTKSYPITIDPTGNYEGNPDSFKQFFLTEEYNLAGFNLDD